MYPDGFRFVLEVWGVVSLVWIIGLSFLIWQNNLFLKKLFPEKGKNFREKLEEVLQEVKSLDEFKKQSLTHIQKVSLKRYNPYQDTGGDQSFSVALLNDFGDGLVITSLHSRAGTRVFAKPVKSGKEEASKFSEEEREVVEKALVNSN